jgi:ribose-phosphate pyrophosphokinase
MSSGQSTSNRPIGGQSSSFIIFCGTAHIELAQGICDELKVPLGKCEIRYFANTEQKPIIDESVRGKHIFIIQTGVSDAEYDQPNKNGPPTRLSLSVSDRVMETLLIMDACTRSGCASITLFMPLYPYARQDKKDKARACISASMVAQQFQVCRKFERILCVELHNPCIQGYFGGACDNLYTSNLMCDELRAQFNVNDLVIVSPDEGGIKRAAVVSGKLARPFIFLGKERDYSKENTVKETKIMGEAKDIDQLQGKTAVIVDDMIDTGGTMIESVKILTKGGAKNVVVIVTHGILSGAALTRINNEPLLEKVIVSNSVPQTKNMQKCPKLSVFKLDKLLAAAVDALVNGKSVSELFDKSPSN